MWGVGGGAKGGGKGRVRGGASRKGSAATMLSRQYKANQPKATRWHAKRAMAKLETFRGGKGRVGAGKEGKWFHNAELLNMPPA